MAKKKPNRERNPVAANMEKFNKPKTYRDKTKYHRPSAKLGLSF